MTTADGRPDSAYIGDDLCRVDQNRATCEIKNKQGVFEFIELSPASWDLLTLLLTDPGRLITHREMAGLRWGYFNELSLEKERTLIHWYICKLREQIETISGQQPIRTVYRRGYRWVTPAQQEQEGL